MRAVSTSSDVVLSRDGITAVQAMFPRRLAASLANLRPGHTVSLRCHIERKMMNTIGRYCELQ
jgi:hypothetical protein